MTTDNPLERMNTTQMSIDRSEKVQNRSEIALGNTSDNVRHMLEKDNSNQIVAIDPGSTESALVWWNGENENISSKGILNNHKVLEILWEMPDTVHHLPTLVIEKIASYGMPVGDSIFNTVFWTGRFYQVWLGRIKMVPRINVKMHLCHNSRAKDSNIRQALIDRFGAPGTKKNPGLTYGLKKDMWQAFALAVTYWDQLS